MNHLSAFFGNQWFALSVYILPFFLGNIRFLTLAAVLFAFAELAMHLFFFNISLKKWYNPGLFTTLVGLLPVSLYYLSQSHASFTWLDYLLALFWIVLNYFIAFRSPLYKKLGRHTVYAFDQDDLDLSKPFLSNIN